MKIRIQLSCLSDCISSRWNKAELSPLEREIQQNAVHAWQQRQPEAKTVRFMQRMPSLHGKHFRFLNVTQQPNGSLLVSRM